MIPMRGKCSMSFKLTDKSKKSSCAEDLIERYKQKQQERGETVEDFSEEDDSLPCSAAQLIRMYEEKYFPERFAAAEEKDRAELTAQAEAKEKAAQEVREKDRAVVEKQQKLKEDGEKLKEDGE